MLAAAGWSGCGLETTGLTSGDATPDLPEVMDVEAEAPEDDAGADDGTEVGCTVDEDCDDYGCLDGVAVCRAGLCTRLEPMLCPNDGVSCTQDYCDPVDGGCHQRPMNSWCGGGMSCDRTLGCIRTATCSEDGNCNLGTACEVDRCLEGGTVCFVDGPDVDGDTYTDRNCVIAGRSGSDCDDGNPDVHPDRPEICGNLVDDDCDQYIDYQDPDSTCTTNLGNDRCVNAVPLVLDGLGANEAPVELRPDFGAEGPASACTFEGPDVWYSIYIPATSDVTFDTIGAAFDTVVALVTVCDGTELLCNDNRNDDPANGSRIVYRALEPGTYRVRVAANAGGTTGSFLLHYSAAPTFTTSCDAVIDATDGGTYLGHVTDASIDSGSCAMLSVGYKERFHVRMDEPANLTIDTTGTTFDHVLYVRDACSAISYELLCTTGEQLIGTNETIGSFAGELWLTLEYRTLGVVEVPPAGPYIMQINP
jgi:hypothetical protein